MHNSRKRHFSDRQTCEKWWRILPSSALQKIYMKLGGS